MRGERRCYGRLDWGERDRREARAGLEGTGAEDLRDVRSAENSVRLRGSAGATVGERGSDVYVLECEAGVGDSIDEARGEARKRTERRSGLVPK